MECRVLGSVGGAGLEQRPQRPTIPIDQGDLIYKIEEAKFNAVVEDFVERHETEQPVLVGTISVEKSELPVAASWRSGDPSLRARPRMRRPGP